MKLKIQAQHLQPGDVVGSGKTIYCFKCDTLFTNKTEIECSTKDKISDPSYICLYTMINVEREGKV